MNELLVAALATISVQLVSPELFRSPMPLL